MTDNESIRPRCYCGRRVRVLWSAPIDENSRPVLVTCGWHPEQRCTYRKPIPDDQVTQLRWQR